jgi:transposase
MNTKGKFVKSYLNREGSNEELAIIYKILIKDTIRQWVLKYNSHEELKSYGTIQSTFWGLF